MQQRDAEIGRLLGELRDCQHRQQVEQLITINIIFELMLVCSCAGEVFTAEQETTDKTGQHAWSFNAYNVKYQDCLLYTSPSPRDATLSRMPSSA